MIHKANVERRVMNDKFSTANIVKKLVRHLMVQGLIL